MSLIVVTIEGMGTVVGDRIGMWRPTSSASLVAVHRTSESSRSRIYRWLRRVVEGRQDQYRAKVVSDAFNLGDMLSPMCKDFVECFSREVGL